MAGPTMESGGISAMGDKYLKGLLGRTLLSAIVLFSAPCTEFKAANYADEYLHEIRARAQVNRQWEVVRDCDFYIGKISGLKPFTVVTLFSEFTAAEMKHVLKSSYRKRAKSRRSATGIRGNTGSWPRVSQSDKLR